MLRIAASFSELIPPQVRCYENEDLEGWLVDEGIGHFDRNGMYQEGPDLERLIEDSEFPPDEPYEELE